MGGPASPLCWNLGYDQVVFAVRAATGAPVPTYVDDLAALVTGAVQALRALIMLVFAGRIAGLRGFVRYWNLANSISRKTMLPLSSASVDAV